MILDICTNGPCGGEGKKLVTMTPQIITGAQMIIPLFQSVNCFQPLLPRQPKNVWYVQEKCDLDVCTLLGSWEDFHSPIPIHSDMECGLTHCFSNKGFESKIICEIYSTQHSLHFRNTRTCIIMPVQNLHEQINFCMPIKKI